MYGNTEIEHIIFLLLPFGWCAFSVQSYNFYFVLFSNKLTNDNPFVLVQDTAGTDTTFITLDWAMTELLMNPQAMEKAQKEVRSILGERRVVAESDLHQLEYMRAVIKEIFWLHPPVPVLVPRESMEDVVIEGYRAPAKTRVFVNAWAIGRDPESWEDPNAFNPESWEDPKFIIDFFFL